MKNPLVMLLAGGGGTRLGVLVQRRSKPAVPFAGSYRIIDFSLSNVMHARLDVVGVLTQYKPLSLMSHIGTGEPWNFTGRRRGVRILPPRTGRVASDWYRGTADAVWQSMDFMEPLKPERVLILSSDHIYRMDYRAMISEHLKRGVDVTVAVMEIPPKDCSRFGMVWTDVEGNITRFEEKPAECDSTMASMGIYLFEWPCLVEALEHFIGKQSGDDFGKHILPALLGWKKLMTHHFTGYWRDVGTISSYFQTSMDALDPSSGLDLKAWEICTRQDSQLAGDRPPARFGGAANLESVLVSGGCHVDGNVTRAILAPDVHILQDARVEDAVILHGATIGPGAIVRKAIIDKDARVGAGAVIDGGRTAVPNQEYIKCDQAGIVLVGKGAQLPDGIQVGSNVVIEAGTAPSAFPADVPDGATVKNPENG